jgi:hypothetical protein
VWGAVSRGEEHEVSSAGPGPFAQGCSRCFGTLAEFIEIGKICIILKQIGMYIGILICKSFSDGIFFHNCFCHKLYGFHISVFPKKILGLGAG